MAAASMYNPLDSTLGSTTGVGDERTFSNVLWNLVFSATGLTRRDVESMRDRDEEHSPTPDVCDLVCDDLKWTEESLIATLRTDLQEYIDVLRSLKQENHRRRQRTVKVKSFVDDKRYTMLREREASLRVTTKTIEQRFRRLDFTKRKLTYIDAGIESLENVDEIDMRQNQLETLDHIPPKARIMMASANVIDSVSTQALSKNNVLLYLGLSCNVLQDITFALASPSLVYLDVSYNAITSIDHVIHVLQEHPNLREIVLLGNPVSLVRNYRALIARHTAILRLDDTDITEEDRTEPLQAPPLPPKKEVVGQPETTEKPTSRKTSRVASQVNTPRDAPPPAAEGEEVPPTQEAPIDSFDFTLKMVELSGAASIVPSVVADDSGASAGKGSKAPPKGKGGDIKSQAPTPTSLPTKRFTVSIEAGWQGIQVATEPMDTVPPPPVDEAPAKGKGKKGPAAADAAPAVSDTLTLNVSEERHMNIEPASVWNLQKPMVVRLIVTEVTSEQTFELGKFFLDLSQLVSTPLHGETVTATAPLTLSRNTLNDMQQAIAHQEEQLVAMIATDASLDRELAQVSTPIQPKEETPAAAKGKGGAKGAAAKPQVSEEVLQMQNESAARKAEIEEAQQKVGQDKRVLEKLKGAAMTLTAQAVINPPYAVPVVEAQPTEADLKKDAKKKR